KSRRGRARERSLALLARRSHPVLSRRDDGDDHGDGGVVDDALGAHAPVDVDVAVGVVERLLALAADAVAAPAEALPAAVVVGDHVLPAVGGVVTGAEPGDRRHLRARRTRAVGAAAARREEAVDPTVPPV